MSNLQVIRTNDMRLFITALACLMSVSVFGQRIFKSQNPNVEIPTKVVNINGERFDAYLCESYSDWQNGSYTKLESKFWYILPHDENGISAIRDTTIQSLTWGWSDDIWYIPYLDGTIENGYHRYYKNGKIQSIQVSDITWPLSNNTQLFNGIDDHMFPILNKAYKPEIKIECDEYGNCIKKITYNPLDCGFAIARSSAMSENERDKLIDDILSKALIIKQDYIDLNQDFKIKVKLRTFGGESTDTYGEGQLRICLGGKFPLKYGGITYYSWGFDMVPEEDDDHDAFQIIKDRKQQNYDDEKITFETTRVRKGIKFENNEELKFNVDYSTISPWMFLIELNKVSDKLYFKLNNKVKNIVEFIPYKTNNIAFKTMNYSNSTQVMNIEIHQEINIENYLSKTNVLRW